MLQPHKWWRGLVVVVPSLFGAAMITGPAVERDVAARMEQAVSATGLVAPLVAVSGRDVTISGAAAGADRAAVEAAIASVAPARAAIADLGALPVANPFGWSLARDASGIVLAGNMPSRAAAQELVAALRAANPGLTITDRTVLAEGAPADLKNLTQFAVTAVSRLSAGRVGFDGNGLTIAGTPVSSEQAAALASDLQALPKAWHARFDGAWAAKGKAELAAAKPAALVAAAAPTKIDEAKAAAAAAENAAKAKAAEMAAEAAAKAKAVEAAEAAAKVKAAEVAAEAAAKVKAAEAAAEAAAKAKAAEVAAEAAAKVKAAEAEAAAKAKAVEMAAQAAEAEARAKAEAQAQAQAQAKAAQAAAIPMPVAAPAQSTTAKAGMAALAAATKDGKTAGSATGTTGTTATGTSGRAIAKIDPSAVVACTVAPQTAFSTTPRFRSGSAKLTREARAGLRTLAKTLIACPSLQVVLHGHADNRGSQVLNERLSRDRAQAVERWLAHHGVAGERMSVEGHGSSEPVNGHAPADHPDNRRVEILVK